MTKLCWRLVFHTQTEAINNDNHDNDDPDDNVGSHDKDHRAIFRATFIYRSVKHPFQSSVWAYNHCPETG
jgi:hypothetical protein